MGSVNSLSPNTVYKMRVEAMDNANVLSSAETEETTGEVTSDFCKFAPLEKNYLDKLQIKN